MLLMQSLNKLNTPEQKLEAIIKKHAELVSGWQTGKIERNKLVACVSSRLFFLCVCAVGRASE